MAFRSKFRKDKKKRQEIGSRNAKKRWDTERLENELRHPEDPLLPLKVLTWEVTNHLTGNKTVLEFKQAFKKNGKPALGKYEILQDGKPWTIASKTRAFDYMSQRTQINAGFNHAE